MSEAGKETHSVVLLGFAGGDGWQAANEEAQHLPGIRQVAVLVRTAEGELSAPESWVKGAGVRTVGSSVAGALIGALGGPIGALLGMAAGAALGNAAETNRDTEEGAGLIMLGARVEDGTALLVLDLHEHSPAPADELAARHGATVERIPAEEFAAQVRAAEAKAEAEAEPEEE
ncbi:histidine kinase [Kitasatospora sp. NPDC002227]|uniref:histidine kinase n=1 Tax=Kitasatospora sp. NPDC002227 TaxID=3154773 RepID=UPI00331FA029